MANPFGGFTVTSPLSSLSHDVQHDLCSNCIRDCFGPTCQTVADCLLSKGPSTLAQLISTIRSHCKRNINAERLKLVKGLGPLKRGRHPVRLNLARGSEEHGFIVEASVVRAALIVLIQHSLVTVKTLKSETDGEAGHANANANANGVEHENSNDVNLKYKYALDYDRATLIQRYPRYVQYAKRVYQEVGAAIVEEILIKGRMATKEVILVTVDFLQRQREDQEEAGEGEGEGAGAGAEAGSSADKAKENPVKEEAMEGDVDTEEYSDKNKELILNVASSLKAMVQDGYIELVQPVSTKAKDITSSLGQGQVPGQSQSPQQRKQQHPHFVTTEETINAVLGRSEFQKFFHPGAVWRVNVQMFHASMRAMYLGQLVSERYSQVKFSGAIVSAALKYVAAKQYSLTHNPIYASEEERLKAMENKTTFTPNDILNFLPPVVRAEMNNRAGGACTNLSAALTEMSKFVYPPVIEEIEHGQGHSEGGIFEVTTRQLLSYLKGRIVHQVVKDHFGDVGARICSILEARGHLEADAVADNAMVPAKDAREMLHQLYKANYISMLYLQQSSKQHNPATAMYLWCVEKKSLHKTIQKNITRALVNLRLRRQHEVEQGKDWIERAKLAGDMDENESAIDKLNYNKFCRGLERIDNSCLQLDETLLIVKDFDF